MAKRIRTVLVSVGVLLLVVVVLVAALPSILSTGPVRRLVMSKVNAAAPGTLAVGDWSFGWFSGVKIDELAYADAQGRFGGEVRSLRVTTGLLKLAVAGKKDLGDVTVDAPRVWCQMDKLQAAETGPAGAPGGKPSAKPPTPKGPSADEPTPEAAPKGPVTIPVDVAVRLRVQDGALTVKQAGQPDTTMALNVQVDCTSLNETITLALDATSRLPGMATDAAPAGVTVRGDVRLLTDGVLDPAAVVANATVRADRFDLGLLSMLRATVPAMPLTAGILTSELKVQAKGVNELVLGGQTSVNGLSLEGGALGQDHLVADTIRFDVDVQRTGERIAINRLALQSALATVSAGGTLTMAPGARLPQGALAVTGQVDLVEVAAQLPHTLKLHEGMRLTGGSLALDVQASTEAEALRFRAAIALRGVAGTRDGATFQMSAPIALSASGAMQPAGGVEVERLSLRAPFASATGSGGATGCVLRLEADLAAVLREASQFVDLGALQAAGILRADVTYAAAAATDRTIDADVSMAGLRVHGLSGRPGMESVPDVDGDVKLKAQVKMGAGETVDAQATVAIEKLAFTGGALGTDQPRLDGTTVRVDVLRAGKAMTIRTVAIESPLVKLQVEGDLDTAGGTTYPKGGVRLAGSLALAKIAEQVPQTLKLKGDLRPTDGRLDLQAKVDTDGTTLSWDAAVGLEALAAQQGEKRLALSMPVKLNTQGALSSEGLRLDGLTLTSGFAQIEGSGHMSVAQLTAAVSLDKAMAELGQFVDLGAYKAAGDLNLSLKMDSPSKAERQLDVHASLKALDLAGFSPKPLKRERVDIAAGAIVRFDEAMKPVAMRAIKLNVDGLPLTVKAAVAQLELPGAEGQSPLKLGEAGVAISGTMEEVLAFCHDAGWLKKELPIKGPLSLDAKLSGGADRIRLTSFNLESTPMTLSASGEISGLADIRAVQLHGSLGLDCTEIAALTEAFAGYRPDMAGKAARDFTLDTQLGAGTWQEILRTTEARAALHADRFSEFGITATDIDLKVGAHAGRVGVALHTQVNDGTLAASPYLDATGAPVMLMPEHSQILSNVTVTAEMATKLLARIHPIFAGCAVGSGRMDLLMENCRVPLGPTVKTETTFVGAMDMRNLSIGTSGLLGQLLGMLKVNASETKVPDQHIGFECRDGRVHATPLTISADGNKIVLVGSVGLDQTLQYAAEVPLTEALVGKDAFKYVKGVTAKVPIGGTVTHPTLDNRALMKAVAEAAGQAAKNALLEEGRKWLGGQTQQGQPAAPAQPGTPAAPASPTKTEPASTPTSEAIDVGKKLLGDFLKKGR